MTWRSNLWLHKSSQHFEGYAACLFAEVLEQDSYEISEFQAYGLLKIKL